jgi:outer membrane receptor for ferrienterochelin and colicin
MINFEPNALDPYRFKVRVDLMKKELRASMTSSVSKKMENIDHAPATVQVITARDIQDRGYADLISLFYDLPGFAVTSSFGSSQQVLNMRGDRAHQYTTDILFLVDGIEDNDIYTNAAFISKQYPISNIKRVEVIYGPSSTMYGANAFAGVINVITKDADDLFVADKEAGAKKEGKAGMR